MARSSVRFQFVIYLHNYFLLLLASVELVIYRTQADKTGSARIHNSKIFRQETFKIFLHQQTNKNFSDNNKQLDEVLRIVDI